MKRYYTELKRKIRIINKKKKIKKKKLAFFISNTAKFKDVPFYFTPIRETKNFYYFGITLFNDIFVKEICNIIDGKFNTIFVDTEKKSLNLKKKNHLTNVERAVKENIKKSYLRFYKANDLTVDAAENFLELQFKSEVRNLGGKKILIIGVGNIGFKLCLRLIERGANVEIYRRDTKKLNQICELINFIKPAGNQSRVRPFKLSKNKLKNFDSIICCAKGTNIIKLKKINELNKSVILLDIGKGMFDQNTLNKLSKNNLTVFRLDVSPSLDMEVENSEIFKQIEKKKYNINKVGEHRLVSNGLLGQKNDIIVDDAKNPKIIFGICDGKGDFISSSKQKKNNITRALYKVLKRKLSFI
ncbi:NAD(P)-binding domain-containing protein [Candidatus Pelagibacter sp.]|nr:NAD(P)-binding domain-containing protein [Candidatus Pelagibacter sp.]